MNDKEKCALMQERIDNGDIFSKAKNKGSCPNCGAVADKDNDNYCWKCGTKLH